MKAERARILDMLHQGAISVEQAEELLDALQRSYQAEPATKPAAEQPAALGLPSPIADPGGFAKGVAQQVMQGLSGAFGALKGVTGAGRTNFSHMHLTNESLEMMPDGSSLTNFGHIGIADDVRPELLQQKIAQVTNFGAITGPSSLLAILESRCDANFGAFGGHEDEGEDEDEEDEEEERESGGQPVFKNVGRTVLTRDHLQQMADGTIVKNIGRLTVAPDVPAELLAQKIGKYVNIGRTYGPSALVGVLQGRCSKNLGRFEPDGPDGEDGE
ncbi:MAG: hypothetical protein ACE149_14170 [Armatimonadota bacterium]